MDRRNALKTIGAAGALLALPGIASASLAPADRPCFDELEAFPYIRMTTIVQHYEESARRLFVGFFRNEEDLTMAKMEKMRSKSTDLWGDGLRFGTFHNERTLIAHGETPESFIVGSFWHDSKLISLVTEYDWDQKRWVTFLDFSESEKRRPMKYEPRPFVNVYSAPPLEVVIYDAEEMRTELYLTVRDGAYFEVPGFMKIAPERFAGLHDAKAPKESLFALNPAS